MKTAVQIKNTKTSFISMLSIYDSCFSSLAEESNIDLILVGDSLANVILGLEKTTEVGIDIMKIFVSAVSRGARNTHTVADMPFNSYETKEDALLNAKAFMELGAHSVKIEGFRPKLIKHLVQNGVPVMGHLGILPQTATSYQKLGEIEYQTLLEQAKKLEKEGAYSLVLEHIKDNIAIKITEALLIPTIGISCGVGTNGQVLVAHDLLGLTAKIPGFVQPVLNLRKEILKAFKEYSKK